MGRVRGGWWRGDARDLATHYVLVYDVGRGGRLGSQMMALNSGRQAWLVWGMRVEGGEIQVGFIPEPCIRRLPFLALLSRLPLSLPFMAVCQVVRDTLTVDQQSV